MKRIVLLLLSIFMLITFQLSLANTNSSTRDSLQKYKFATPEQTWSQFKTAILKGDFDTARECCCQGRRTKGVFMFEKMDAGKRKSIIGSMQEITKVELEENSAKYKLVRNSNGTYFHTYVYFEKIDNKWKIKKY